MSGTANKTSTRKTSASKSSARTVEGTVATGDALLTTQTQQDAVSGTVISQTKEGTGNGQLEPTKATDGATGGNDSVLGILGAFKVRAKSAQGFWRSGVQFLRTKETIVFVVDEQLKTKPETASFEGFDPECMVFMSQDLAKRVHQEPNLVVEDVELSEVLDLEDMAQ